MEEGRGRGWPFFSNTPSESKPEGGERSLFLKNRLFLLGMSNSSKELGLSVDLMVEDLCSSCSFFLLEVLDFLPHQAGMATRRRRTRDERERIRIGERSRRRCDGFSTFDFICERGEVTVGDSSADGPAGGGWIKHRC